MLFGKIERLGVTWFCVFSSEFQISSWDESEAKTKRGISKAGRLVEIFRAFKVIWIFFCALPGGFWNALNFKQQRSHILSHGRAAAAASWDLRLLRLHCTVPLLDLFGKNVKLSHNSMIQSNCFLFFSLFQYGGNTLPSLSESCFSAGKDFKVMFLNVPLPCWRIALELYPRLFCACLNRCQTEDAFMNGPHCGCVPERLQVQRQRHGTLEGHWLCVCVFQAPAEGVCCVWVESPWWFF